MQDHPMGFDWIFFVIVFTPVVFALLELARTWKVTPSDVTWRR